MEVSGQFHASAALPLREKRSTHWIGRVVVSRAGLDVSEKRKILVPAGILT
jgi:hypothetical protein